MASNKEPIHEPTEVTVDAESPETLAAIDEGIRDADAGRTVTADEVRKQMSKWTTESSTRKGR